MICLLRDDQEEIVLNLESMVNCDSFHLAVVSGEGVVKCIYIKSNAVGGDGLKLN